MSIWNRLKGMMRRPEPPRREKTVMDCMPGDALEVSLAMYEVIGKMSGSGRREAMITLKDGAAIKYLYVEQREAPDCILYEEIDGRLDQYSEVPSTIELDDVSYYLEEEYTVWQTVTGRTPFTAAGEMHVWRFQSDDRQLLRIEWMQGRFMLYQGERILPSDVHLFGGS
ncbi:DUF4178 domain-containing protein [Xylanibacillus composti]|uniref:DUF4178 domain-containing protein n=1 Tax=Xylanibacillus composti TaxID=1572762 RepID=A0A8J4M3N4_9BACL|nr:DUF4178 domain-containing protein [Xylanibacillus composti]MDT9724588.1 DUF4178 domain-containing protein [Xylanibacillus composti]GIQ70252.1 hypothetical protein XYCOK13_30760 [Xylanibacillus composti]